MKEGVLVGCDRYREWLLKWWWDHYRMQNSHPVVFVDFGMTPEALKWCEDRGRVLSLNSPKNFVYPQTLVDRELVADWENRHGPIEWHSRCKRFCKPFAMLQTPFEKSLWLDLDCEVVGSLASLFQKIHSQSGFALTVDRSFSVEEMGYSSGVIAYFKHSPLLHQWAQSCLEHNDRFYSDQEILAFLIHSENIEVTELAEKYNWKLRQGVNLEAAVLHWSGVWGKQVLRREIHRRKEVWMMGA